MGVIKGICISEKRGTAKHEIEEAVFVKDWGIEKDAHAGHWHRQVSLLSYEKIEEFRKKGAQIGLGAFGENLVVSGIDFRSYSLLYVHQFAQPLLFYFVGNVIRVIFVGISSLFV